MYRKSWFTKRFSSRRVGFYATRFVIAETANDAMSAVFEMLMVDLEKDGRTTEDSSIELEEIREDEDGFDLYAPGEGYSFYGEDERS